MHSKITKHHITHAKLYNVKENKIKEKILFGHQFEVTIGVVF